jgi:hypothetical protein
VVNPSNGRTTTYFRRSFSVAAPASIGALTLRLVAGLSTGEIARNIIGVADAARMTSEGVAETQQATAELARMSTELSSLVSNFRL